MSVTAPQQEGYWQLVLPGIDELLYERFARELARQLEVPIDAPKSLNEVACAYLERRPHLEVVQATLRAIIEKRDYPVPDALVKLASIEPFRLFLTTTCDATLEAAIRQVRGKSVSLAYSVGYDNPEGDLPVGWSSSADPAPTVFHLFGQPFPFNDYAITDEDVLEYIHSLQSSNRMPRRLFEHLDSRYLLIIGSSYPDWLARFFIRVTKPGRLWMAKNRGDFLAGRTAHDDESHTKFLQHFGTHMKVFPTPPLDFLDELYERWKSSPSSQRQPKLSAPTLVPAISTPKARSRTIFISYASEDMAYAKNLHDTLSDSGLEVWLDEERLGGGERVDRSIFRDIDASALFLPVISARSAEAEGPRFYRDEWTYAIESIRRRPPNAAFVIPIAIDDTPLGHPGLPEELGDFRWIRARDGALSAKQVAVIARWLGIEPATAEGRR